MTETPDARSPALSVRGFTPEEEERYRTARMLAVRRFPYLARSLVALRPLAVEGLGTFAVDAQWRVYVDPAALERWTVGQAAAVIVHETMHVLRDHAVRAEPLFEPADSEAALAWNVACDVAINDDMQEVAETGAGPFVVELPIGSLVPSTFDLPAGQLEEFYFHRLDRPVAGVAGGPVRVTVVASVGGPDDDSDVDGPCLCGGGSGTGPGRDELSELADERGEPGLDPLDIRGTQQATRRDVAAHASRGSVPAGLKVWSDGADRPEVPWRRVLRRAVRRSLRATSGWEDPTYRVPNRRSSPSDRFIRPGSRSWVATVAVVVDTSGSMGRRELGRALGELQGILDAGRRGRVLAYSCDTELTRLPASRRLSELADHLVGGGGTDMSHAIQQVVRPAKPADRPDLVVVLTDGLTGWPAEPVGCPVIAVIIGRSAWADRLVERVPGFISTVSVPISQ